MNNYGHVGLQLYAIRGRAYYELNDLNKAEENFNNAVEIAPCFSYAYKYLPLINKRRNRIDDILIQ